MDPGEVMEFGGLLTYLYQGTDEQRALTQQKYSQLISENPDRLVMLLCSLNTSEDPNLRKLSMVFLRRAIIHTNPCIWGAISQETRDFVKSHLMALLSQSCEADFVLRVADTIGDLAVASVSLAGDVWQNFFEYLYQIAQSSLEIHRQAALGIWGFLLLELPHVMEPYLGGVKEVIAKALNDNSLKVRISALSCTTSTINGARKSTQRDALQPLLPSMIGVLRDCFSSPSSSDVCNALESFVRWTQDPRFLEPCLDEILNLFFEIIVKVSNIEYKHLSIDFLVSLTRKQPKKMIKYPGFLWRLTRAILVLMLDFDSFTIEEWNALDDSVIAEECDAFHVHRNLDDLAMAVGTPLLTHLLPITQEYLSSMEWVKRAAALDALMLVAQGCKHGLTKNLDSVVDLLIRQAHFDNPRVRWGIINVIGEYSSIFPTRLKKYNTTFYEIVLQGMGDVSNSKVQVYSVIALESLVEHFSIDVTLKYLESALQLLYELLKSRNMMLLKEVVSAIGAVASKVGPYFVPYYSTFMAVLNEYLDVCRNEKGHRLLGDAIIETISFVGLAVGKEIFISDADRYMKMLQNVKWDAFNEPDSNREALLYAATRVAKCLRADFLPYLPVLLGPLFETITMDASNFIKVSDHDPVRSGLGMKEDEEEDGWTTTSFANKRVSIMNSALEQKCESLELLYCLIETMDVLLLPYLSEYLAYILSQLNFPYNKRVRAMSTRCVSLISSTAKKSVEQAEWRQLNWKILQDVIKSIPGERSYHVVAVKFEECSNMIDLFEDNQLDVSQIEEVVQLMQTFILGLEQVSKKRNEMKCAGNYTDEMLDEWKDNEAEEREAVTEVANTLGLLSRRHTVTYLQVIRRYFQDLVVLLDHPQSMFRQLSITIFADLSEHAPESLHFNIEFLIRKAIENVLDPLAHLRSAAAYMLGKCAQKSPQYLKPHLDTAINNIASVIREEDAKSEKYIFATESAICALTKILYHYPELGTTRRAYLLLLLSQIPICIDDTQAITCHRQICELVQLDLEPFLEDKNNFKTLLTFFSWCFSEEAIHPLVDQDIKYKIRDILNQIQNINQDIIHYCTSTMDSVVINCLAVGIQNLS